jgi:hypothetical protein
MNLNEKIDIEYADTFFKRFKGLMGRKDIDHALIFANHKDSSIHTHFMRFDIDVYFLDENNVVFEKATLTPWKFYRPKKRAKYIIETKKDALKIKMGDCLEFI